MKLRVSVRVRVRVRVKVRVTAPVEKEPKVRIEQILTHEMEKFSCDSSRI